MSNLLSSITSPDDLRDLETPQLKDLAGEMREYIREFTNVTGGHIGSGMGVIELTIALHASFDFLEHDHLVLDVGHQCYPHKILTGRREEMYSIRQAGGLSGFPDPKESPYDRVKTGHGGTSLTTALGLAVGMRNAGHRDRMVVAMIGDGALQEGVALEALNHAGEFSDLPLIIVLNDNEMGISPAVGALSKYFSNIRAGSVYRAASEQVDRSLKSIESDAPKIGSFMRDVIDHVKVGMHSLLPAVRPGVLFEELGYFYYGPVDGHDIPTLMEAFRRCRKLKCPVVIHAITKKGMGYSEKEDRLCYHAGNPDKQLTSHVPQEFSAQGGATYTDIFVEEAMQMAAEDPRVIALTAAMLEGTGLVRFQEKYPTRCFDVGMAEQHAVGMAQGLALAGQKPICAVYSTFLQRAVDQIFQEIALINTPVLMCLDRAGVVGPDGATHNGVFDIAYCRMFPNMTVMAPRDGSELRAMMRMGLAHNGPTAIRFPRTKSPLLEKEKAARNFSIGESELLEDGREGCIIAYGAMVYPALDAAAQIQKDKGLKVAVVNGRFAKPLDARMLEREFSRQPWILTLEDHVVAGGFGSAVLERAAALGLDSRKLTIGAIEDSWVDHGQRVEALASAGLDVSGIIGRIENILAAQPNAAYIG